MRRLIPNFILEKYRLGETRGVLRGAALFVDLSGFSKMTDVLAAHGQPGAEALAEMMRLVFEPLVGAVYAQSGFVIGYAGDAFNAVFPEEQAEGPAVMQGLSALVEMQAHIRERPLMQTVFGEYPISIKAGLGLGETRWQIFKSVDGTRATFWFRGDSLEGAVEAEECAPPGEIVVDTETHAILKDLVEAEPVGNCYRIVKVKAELPAPRVFPDPEPDPDLLRVFMPESVLHFPAVGEFRQVVNLFIDIPATISDEALMVPFMESVFALQEVYGGFFLRPDLGDKGFNLLMFWGAPLAHENDVVRALDFVLDLSERTRLPLRAGLTYRVAYAGFMGADLREEYTAYGWGVTLAARLMDHAKENEVWLDSETAGRAEKQFHVRLEGDFLFKGFSREQKVFVLTGRKPLTETVYRGELVGRESELAALEKLVKPLWNGRFAGVILVEGEAGIGKSRLIHTFQHSNSFAGQKAQWIICQCDEILRLPFNPFMDWLGNRFHYLEGQPEQINKRAFSQRMQELIDSTRDAGLANELTRTSSILAALLNLRSADSLYEQLDARGRYENTLSALSALLCSESLRKPLVLFVEDCHWMDDDSRTFLAYFVRTILTAPERDFPIAIIATQRPGSKTIPLEEGAQLSAIKLEKLSASELSRLAEDILGAPPHPSLLKILEERAEGNPFFAEQLVQFLMENRMLTLCPDGSYETAARAQISLPRDVNALLIARLDGLAREVRETVQTAAVLGREFEIRLLGEMLRGSEKFLENVGQAEKSAIWFALNEISYIFHHAMLWDAAYSMQLVKRRRELHALAVAAMESIYAKDLEAHYAELAFHSERANLTAKALYYLPLAGKASAGAYQNSQALDYFNRVLALVPTDDLRARYDILVERAEVFGRMADRKSQLRDLDEMEALAHRLDDKTAIARAWKMRAYYFMTLADYRNVVEYASRSAELAREAGHMELLLAAYIVWPQALLRLGDMNQAMQRARECLDFARRSSNRLEEGNALTSVGLIALEHMDADLAKACLEESVAIAREIKNRMLEAKALNNLANLAATIHGDLDSAREYYELAYAIGFELGDRYTNGISLTNLGWVAGLMGDFAAARDYLARALPIAREVGNRYQEVYALINLSAAAGAQEDAQVALDYASQALELSVKTSDLAGEAWSSFYKGQAFLLSGAFELAEDMFRRSIRIREELGLAHLVIESTSGLVQAALLRNDLPAAGREVEKILRYLNDGGTLDGVEEPLRVYYACIQALAKTKDPRSTDMMNQAVRLLEVQLSKLRTEEARRMYVENVPWRRAIREMSTGTMPKKQD